MVKKITVTVDLKTYNDFKTAATADKRTVPNWLIQRAYGLSTAPAAPEPEPEPEPEPAPDPVPAWARNSILGDIKARQGG